MKINKRKVIPAVAIIGLTLGAAGVSAAELQNKSVSHSHETAKHKEEFEDVFKNLTEDQKKALDKARNLHKQGKHDEAREVLESADLPLPHMRDPEQHKERKREFDSLIESNDYEAFRQKVADTPMADVIDSREKFDALVESHSLREDGKFEEAREVLADAGIKPPQRKMHVRYNQAQR